MPQKEISSASGCKATDAIADIARVVPVACSPSACPVPYLVMSFAS